MAQPAPAPPPETDAEREARLAWERVRLAEAEEDIKAGRYIEGDEAIEWLDRWAAGEDLEDPYPPK